MDTPSTLMIKIEKGSVSPCSELINFMTFYGICVGASSEIESSTFHFFYSLKNIRITEGLYVIYILYIDLSGE